MAWISDSIHQTAAVIAMARVRIPAARSTRVLQVHCPSRREGAGNAGRSMHPQPRMQIKKHTSVVTTVTPVSPGIPRANGFNGFLRALPGDRAFLSPSLATMREHRRQLGIGVEMPGPHDFAVRGQHIRLVRYPRPSHPAPTFVTTRTPLCSGAGRLEGEVFRDHPARLHACDKSTRRAIHA